MGPEEHSFGCPENSLAFFFGDIVAVTGLQKKIMRQYFLQLFRDREVRVRLRLAGLVVITKIRLLCCTKNSTVLRNYDSVTDMDSASLLRVVKCACDVMFMRHI